MANESPTSRKLGANGLRGAGKNINLLGLVAIIAAITFALTMCTNDINTDGETYTVSIQMIGNGDGDLVVASPASGKAGKSVTLEYTVADTEHCNLLDFGGVSVSLDSVASAGNGTRSYTINPDDAESGNEIIITATFEHTVNYTIVFDKIDDADGDSVVAVPDYGVEGDSITIEYTVADTAYYNLLDFGGVFASLDPVTSAESGTRTYTINLDDVTDGNKIIIIATFEHTDLVLDPIAFTDASPHLVKVYDDPAFTNSITATYSGSGAVTYSSEDEDVATVDANGKVTILEVGTTVITAHKAQDAVYAAASNSYTLSVRLFDQAWIPPGTFQMGSPSTEKGRHTPNVGVSNENQHEVKLTSGYYIGRYQVTQAQYMWVMGTNPSRYPSDPIAGEIQGKRPVEYVSWYNAIVFANKLSVLEGLRPAYRIRGFSNSTDPDVWGTVPSSVSSTWDAVEIVAGSNGYRLPTEAQWEYACRAETETAYNDGNDDYLDKDKVGLIAWYISNSGTNGGSSSRKTHEVGLKLPNKWGLYDMHGNVSEWCWDWYSVDYYESSPLEDPQGPSSLSYRVYRGGNWNVATEDIRSAYRSQAIAYTKFGEVGFRLVRP